MKVLQIDEQSSTAWGAGGEGKGGWEASLRWVRQIWTTTAAGVGWRLRENVKARVADLPDAEETNQGPRT